MRLAMTWEEMCADPHLRDLPYKIEQDRFGRIVMSPVNSDHGRYQVEISYLLRTLLPSWAVLVECGVDTADGTKAPDVAAMPPEMGKKYRGAISLDTAPPICVEVLSPSNAREEILEKMRFYADRGCAELWICSSDGILTFLDAKTGRTMERSVICPAFPGSITLG